MLTDHPSDRRRPPIGLGELLGASALLAGLGYLVGGLWGALFAGLAGVFAGLFLSNHALKIQLERVDEQAQHRQVRATRRSRRSKGERVNDQTEAIKKEIDDGTLVPALVARDFTITVSAGAPSPETGDVWLLAGEPYLITEVSGQGPTRSGKLRHLAARRRRTIAAWPGCPTSSGGRPPWVATNRKPGPSW
jgi:hypothetical protein